MTGVYFTLSGLRRLPRLFCAHCFGPKTGDHPRFCRSCLEGEDR